MEVWRVFTPGGSAEVRKAVGSSVVRFPTVSGTERHRRAGTQKSPIGGANGAW